MCTAPLWKVERLPVPLALFLIVKVRPFIRPGNKLQNDDEGSGCCLLLFSLSAMLFEPLKKFGHLLLGVGFAVGVVAIELPPHV